jgi:hypothetical protein
MSDHIGDQDLKLRHDPRGGRRKDGKPFKPGNERADGGFEIGKNRTPKATRFAVGDGRPRGKRPKDRKNLLTEWREELDAKIPINEGGKVRKVSKRRGLIKSQIDRGLKKSDRAAETALRYAELSERRDPGLQEDDLEIIAAWLKAMQSDGDSDDADYAALAGPDGNPDTFREEGDDA